MAVDTNTWMSKLVALFVKRGWSIAGCSAGISKFLHSMRKLALLRVDCINLGTGERYVVMDFLLSFFNGLYSMPQKSGGDPFSSDMLLATANR